MDIYNTDYTQAEGKKNGVLEDNLRKDREIAQTQRDNFRKAHRAGVRMVFASDAGVMPHGQVGKQFKTMVDYGMTPLEAIQAATRNAAEALGAGRRRRRSRAGRYGDMVAVTGDPTTRRHPARAGRCGDQGRQTDRPRLKPPKLGAATNHTVLRNALSNQMFLGSQPHPGAGNKGKFNARTQTLDCILRGGPRGGRL